MATDYHKTHRVEEVKDLTPSAYIVRFQKNGMQFQAGQNLNLGLKGDTEKRDYSIYSPEQNEFLEVLIKEITTGLVSKKLRRLQEGDELEVDGPFGFFTISGESRKKNKFLFIASGSGIAPFHSLALSYPEMDYQLIHGIRNSDEAYERKHYANGKYISCVTADKSGDFHGRVTDYLKQNPPDKDTLCYLCGNVNMIYDAFDILKEQGLPSSNLFAEVYF
ncbi:MAG: oxidoreductase [Chlorobi bacterium]|nr:oxidoreductase [Chlorobiota bacterium]